MTPGEGARLELLAAAQDMASALTELAEGNVNAAREELERLTIPELRKLSQLCTSMSSLAAQVIVDKATSKKGDGSA
jgi:hypothetical protein